MLNVFCVKMKKILSTILHYVTSATRSNFTNYIVEHICLSLILCLYTTFHSIPRYIHKQIPLSKIIVSRPAGSIKSKILIYRQLQIKL